MFTKFKLSLILFILLISSCKTDEENPMAPEFDRAAFLSNYADNFILPGLEELINVSADFMQLAQQFKENGTSEDLLLMRDAWVPLYSSWLKVVSFNFGPAGAEGLRRTMFEEQGGFPALENMIEDKIASGLFELDDSNRSSRGLCSIQYLLFKELDPELALVTFDQNRMSYLFAICEGFDLFIKTIYNDWLNSYRNDFVGNLNTNVTSSTTRMYNGFLMDYFRLTEGKIATPMGLVAKQTEVDPTYTDVFHSGLSGRYAEEHFNNLKDLYYGITVTSDTLSPSWRDYLSFTDEGLQLSNDIDLQLDKVDIAFDLLSSDKSFEEMIIEENTSLNTLLEEMRALNHYFESDMSSILGLAVTFDIDDGD